MIPISLEDIFYNFDFVEETNEDLTKAEQALDAAINKAVNGEFKLYDLISCESNNVIATSRCAGFIQGVNFVRSIMFGDLISSMDKERK